MIADLAADEIDAIGKKAEDKRSDEEKVRVVQLKNLDLYLLDGRDADRRGAPQAAGARRRGGGRQGRGGARRAQARARAAARSDHRAARRDPGASSSSTPTPRAPPRGRSCPTPRRRRPRHRHRPSRSRRGSRRPRSSERQGGLRDRLEEVRARLTAATEAKPPTDKPADPKQVKLIERVKAALPFVVEASTAMDRAREALAGAQTKTAIEQRRARRWSRWPKRSSSSPTSSRRSSSRMATRSGWSSCCRPRRRSCLLPSARRRPTRRSPRISRGCARIKELIADELAALEEIRLRIPRPDPKQVEAAKQQLEQEKQRYARAEQLRGEAADRARAARQGDLRGQGSTAAREGRATPSSRSCASCSST